LVTGVSEQAISSFFKGQAVEDECREQVGAFLYSGGCNRYSGKARALTDYPVRNNAPTSSRNSSSTA